MPGRVVAKKGLSNVENRVFSFQGMLVCFYN